ncbi:hypothetical protein D3C72_829030 [compost metagenome]
MSDKPAQRGNHPARHPKPYRHRNQQQDHWRQQEQRLQISEAIHQRLAPFSCPLFAQLLIARVVIIKVGLKRLGGDGKKGVNGVGLYQPFRLLIDGAVE